jgi:hypothetical protein
MRDVSFKNVDSINGVHHVHSRVHDYPMDVYPIVDVNKKYPQERIKPYQQFCSVLSNHLVSFDIIYRCTQTNLAR